MWRMAMGTRQREQRVRGDFVQVYQNFGNSLAERGRIELPETLSVFDGRNSSGGWPTSPLLDPKKAWVLEKIYSPVIRLFFGSLLSIRSLR
jgi:hypothetical protein